MSSVAADGRNQPSALDLCPTILSVAFPYAPIGPLAVGGAEVICSQVEGALGSLGFRSVVVAHGASQTQGKLYGTQVPAGIITDEVRFAVEEAQQANIDRALASESVALVHMHGLDFERYRVPAHVPVLVTLHLPPTWYPESIWSLPANYHLVCVSETQRHACPESARERITVVENGVVLPNNNLLRPEGRYALMLARICPEKNLHTGLDAARLAGMAALLGGEVFPYAAHLKYFHDEIEPRLTALGEVHEDRRQRKPEGPTARFVGAVAREEKVRIMSRAACLLLPTLAPETSSLVAMEALAAGVPVIGMAVGAVPEIVEDSVTGFLIPAGDNAVEAMADAIRRVPQINRNTCRTIAERRFPIERMLEGYFALYRKFSLPYSPLGRAEVAGDFTLADASSAAGKQLTLSSEQIVVEELSRQDDLERLAPEWERLWHSDASTTPFQHPGWLLPWWHQFGADGELRGVTLRERQSGQLVGLLPTYVYRDPETHRRKLLLIGAGTTDYLDGVWAEDRAVLGDVALHALLRSNGAWEDCSLQQLRANCPLVHAAKHGALAVADSEPTSVIDVSAELPAKIRANAGRYRRHADKMGHLALHVAQRKDEALAMFDELAKLHSRRWNELGEPGVLADERVLAHHREAIPRLLDAGLLRMFYLTLSGETIGVLYGLADVERRPERRIYLYLIGFSERYAELSPGTLLLYEVWAYARENNFAKLDLLRGGEAYKALWGTAHERTFSVRISRE